MPGRHNLTKPMQQIISIRQDGTVFGLHFKSKGLDLTKLGPVEIRRVSEIEWDQREQRWFIRPLHEDMPERDGLRLGTLQGSIAEQVELLSVSAAEDGRALFAHYEEAVAAEVAFIQWLRLTGAMKE